MSPEPSCNAASWRVVGAAPHVHDKSACLDYDQFTCLPPVYATYVYYMCTTACYRCTIQEATQQLHAIGLLCWNAADANLLISASQFSMDHIPTALQLSRKILQAGAPNATCHQLHKTHQPN